ncbi:MAG: hypothetical protein Q4C83_01815 [Candidatus Saccharibacteria bacterium]|nr:hypothetical protein [Candidatus Saccharibacteria bacterium]
MKKVAIITVSAIIGLGSLALPVNAIPSDEVIRANCQSAQQVLGQMEKADAALRINRGRVYNEITDLFYAMNSRLAGNKISAPKLATITSDFEDQLKDFRNSYNDYDDELTALIEMKCQSKPSDFYDRLTKVRDSRADLNQKINDLDQLLIDYQNEFNDNVRGLIDGK